MYIVSGDDEVISDATSKRRLSTHDDDATQGNNEAQEANVDQENNQQVVLPIEQRNVVVLDFDLNSLPLDEGNP
jgi:hypothetical protein